MKPTKTPPSEKSPDSAVDAKKAAIEVLRSEPPAPTKGRSALVALLEERREGR